MIKNTRIITPYKSNIKYYFSEDKIFFSKVLPENLTFPYNTGVFENTMSISKNPLKNIIVFKHSLHPGTFIKSKILGGFTYTDEKGIHQRIISVPEQCNEENIFSLKSFILDELKFFFTSYNNLTNNKITFGSFISKEQSEEIYDDSRFRWDRVFNNVLQPDNDSNTNDSQHSINSDNSNKSDSIKRKFSKLFRRKPSIAHDN